jgi:hypothetical protein
MKTCAIRSILVCCLALSFSACGVLNLLMPNRPTTGRLEIIVYSQFVADKLADDPTATVQSVVDQNNLNQYSLVRIAGLGTEYHIGDRYGIISLSDVPLGTYTVHPLFMASSLDQSVTVTAGTKKTMTIVLPRVICHGYLVQSSFEDSAVRQAIAAGLERSEILTAANLEDATVLMTVLPTAFRADGRYSPDELIEGAIPDTIAGDTPLTFSLSYDDNAYHPAVAATIKAQLEAYHAVGEVELNPLTWVALTALYSAGSNYDLARIGWSFTSNNPVPFLQRIFTATGYAGADYTMLSQQIDTALAAGDATGYLELVELLHTLLVDKGLFIPLFQQ